MVRNVSQKRVLSVIFSLPGIVKQVIETSEIGIALDYGLGLLRH